MFYIYTLILLTVITGCYGSFCYKDNPESPFGRDSESCMTTCCGPVDDQHCCISDGLFLALMMMLPPLFLCLCVFCWCCFLRNQNPPLSNIADNNGHEPEFSENASAPPTVSYMNNPDGTASYSYSSGLHPNSNVSPDSATSYPPTFSNITTFTNDYHTEFGTPSGNEGGGGSCGGGDMSSANHTSSARHNDL